jgi:antirestriction protein
MTQDKLQVWIGCLAAYNEGHLHGKWVDALDVEEMEAAKDEIIKTSPALLPEEWFVADYNGFPHDVVAELGEYPQFETVANVANALEDHGAVFGDWLSTQDYGFDLSQDDLGDQFLEHYRGDWDSEEDFAMEQACELGWNNVPAQVEIETGRYPYKEKLNVFDELSSYIDWAAIAREMFQHGNYTYVNGHVFEDEV